MKKWIASLDDVQKGCLAVLMVPLLPVIIPVGLVAGFVGGFVWILWEGCLDAVDGLQRWSRGEPPRYRSDM